MKDNPCKTCHAARSLGKRPKRNTFVMFVGLSFKPGTEALCPSTNSGKLIGEIERRVASAINVHRTNLVKCAPCDGNGKLRYPTSSEMKSCLPTLLAEIDHYQPRVIVPLGGQVTKFMLASLLSTPQFGGFADDFDYQAFSFNGSILLPVHHPSYIWIYRRKHVHEYVSAVGKLLLTAASTA